MNCALHLWASALLIGMVFMSAATAAPQGRVPEHTIMVKGAWPSASDATTPLPESGQLTAGSYQNEYFGLTLHLPARWQAGLDGPPPSDSGSYVLAQIVPGRRFEGGRPGYLLITAQDIFFTASQANSALEQIDFTAQHLDRTLYRVERAPREVRLARHTFIRFAYSSPIAGMQWTVLATEIRCHIVEFIFVSTNPKGLTALLQAMNTIALPATAGVHSGAGGAGAPLCIRNYASAANVIRRGEPVLTEPRYNPIPVRIIIDQQGKVRHIHFLRAFPDQAKAITDALWQWRFRPHVVAGKAAEVETGILFGRGTQGVVPTVASGAHRAPARAGS